MCDGHKTKTSHFIVPISICRPEPQSHSGKLKLAHIKVREIKRRCRKRARKERISIDDALRSVFEEGLANDGTVEKLVQTQLQEEISPTYVWLACINIRTHSVVIFSSSSFRLSLFISFFFLLLFRFYFETLALVILAASQRTVPQRQRQLLLILKSHDHCCLRRRQLCIMIRTELRNNLF